MKKMILATVIVGAAFLAPSLGQAGSITIRGFTIAVPTDNPTRVFAIQKAMDGFVESCPAFMEYRSDIQHYGQIAMVEIMPWDVDSPKFAWYHAENDPKSGPSEMAQIAARFGWDRGLFVDMAISAHPRSKIILGAKSRMSGEPGGPSDIYFFLGGGNHPGVVMAPYYQQFCKAVRSAEIRMPKADPKRLDEPTFIYVANDDMRGLDF